MDTPALPGVAKEQLTLLFEFEARNGFKTDILKYIKIGFAGGVFQPLPGAPGSSHPTPLDRDVAQPFGRKKSKPPPRKSETIFVDIMGCSYTHQQQFRHGVDEHPHFGP